MNSEHVVENTMTDKDLQDTLAALERTRRDTTASRESALKYLQRLGMTDRNGKLTARYKQPAQAESKRNAAR